jgi:hypothetical protein
MSKSSDLLRNIFLTDPEFGNQVRIVGLGTKEGEMEFRLYTQTTFQRHEGVAMRYRIQAEEIEWPVEDGAE